MHDSFSCRYRDLFEAIKEPLLDTIEQGQGARRPTIEGLQPDVHNALHSMEQPEFSAMLTKMTGELPAAEAAARQHNDNFGQSMMNESSFDLGVMPELAFDFSLPFDSCDVSSFDPTAYSGSDMRAWCNGVHPAEPFAHDGLNLHESV